LAFYARLDFRNFILVSAKSFKKLPPALVILLTYALHFTGLHFFSNF
jgi:hypothetical protein